MDYELDKKGELVTKRRTFHENGNKKCFHKIEDKATEILCYNRQGEINSITNYSLGKLEGLQKDFFNNGEVKSISNYKNGVKNGKEEIYYDNKQLYQIKLWEDDKLMNIGKCYSKKGVLLNNGTLKDGTGILNVYFEDGELKVTKVYKNGEYQESY